jgi:hypothetical protein
LFAGGWLWRSEPGRGDGDLKRAGIERVDGSKRSNQGNFEHFVRLPPKKASPLPA